MTDYNCYQYAKELGFTEEEAQALQASKLGKGQPSHVLQRLAKAKNLPSTRPPLPVIPPEPSPLSTSETSTLRPIKDDTTSKLPAKRKRATRTRARKA